MAVDMNRDEAVRAVAVAMESCCRECALDPDQGIWKDATRAVDALIAAGWGDLTAERERADVADSLTRTVIAAREHSERTLAAERDEARAAIARIEALLPAPGSFIGYAGVVSADDVRAALRGDQP